MFYNRSFWDWHKNVFVFDAKLMKHLLMCAASHCEIQDILNQQNSYWLIYLLYNWDIRSLPQLQIRGQSGMIAQNSKNRVLDLNCWFLCSEPDGLTLPARCNRRLTPLPFSSSSDSITSNSDVCQLICVICWWANKSMIEMAWTAWEKNLLWLGLDWQVLLVWQQLWLHSV